MSAGPCCWCWRGRTRSCRASASCDARRSRRRTPRGRSLYVSPSLFRTGVLSFRSWAQPRPRLGRRVLCVHRRGPAAGSCPVSAPACPPARPPSCPITGPIKRSTHNGQSQGPALQCPTAAALLHQSATGPYSARRQGPNGRRPWPGGGGGGARSRRRLAHHTPHAVLQPVAGCRRQQSARQSCIAAARSAGPPLVIGCAHLLNARRRGGLRGAAWGGAGVAGGNQAWVGVAACPRDKKNGMGPWAVQLELFDWSGGERAGGPGGRLRGRSGPCCKGSARRPSAGKLPAQQLTAAARPRLAVCFGR